MSRSRSARLQSGEPSQRQLRAGELIRQAMVEILSREDFRDPALQNQIITLGEVRCSPDLRHANIFCAALGETDRDAIDSLAAALNRARKFLRGRLGRQIEMKFTPELHFIPDHSYNEASDMNAVFRRSEIARDLD